MKQRPIRAGRPKGATTVDPVVASSIGTAVRFARTSRGIAQETLAHMALIERSHLGKIERGQHAPSLAAFMRIAHALEMTSATLMSEVEALLPEDHFGG